jgi:hypothetical protein
MMGKYTLTFWCIIKIISQMKLIFLPKRLISRSSQKGATERVRERDLLCCLFCFGALGSNTRLWQAS